MIIVKSITKFAHGLETAVILCFHKVHKRSLWQFCVLFEGILNVFSSYIKYCLEILYKYADLEAYVAIVTRATRTREFTQSLQLVYKLVDVQPNWLFYLPLLRLTPSHQSFHLYTVNSRWCFESIWACRRWDSCSNFIPEKILLDSITEVNDPMHWDKKK